MSLINYLTRIHFAEHVLEDALGLEMTRLGGRRPLILIDADGEAGRGRALLDDALPSGCTPVWSEVRTSDPPKIDMPCQKSRGAPSLSGCDLLVAFGGAAAQVEGRRLASGAEGRVALISIPTTISDMGLATGVAPARSAARQAAVPAAILCDPTLTYWLSPDRTAAHGFDVMTHCIEAFLAPGFNPPADGIALDGIHRLARHLVDAVEHGDRPEPRREVMAAALNGALAGQKGLGGVEALTRAIQAESRDSRPRGWHHASVLPRMLTFNAPAVGDRYDRIGAAMQVRSETDPIAAIAEIGARVGLPDRIGHLGFGPAALGRVARNAAADPASQTNPRHATQADYLGLLSDAI